MLAFLARRKAPMARLWQAAVRGVRGWSAAGGILGERGVSYVVPGLDPPLPMISRASSASVVCSAVRLMIGLAVYSATP